MCIMGYFEILRQAQDDKISFLLYLHLNHQIRLGENHTNNRSLLSPVCKFLKGGQKICGEDSLEVRFSEEDGFSLTLNYLHIFISNVIEMAGQYLI